MKLTIAIPTYNRNKILAENLGALLPQLTPECQVRIFDNCSATPVAHTLGPLLDRFPTVNCEIVRSRVNVGANANIMRCFEACETEWLWVIGDDDLVTPGAVAIILRDIQQAPETFFFNYSTAAYPIAARTSRHGLAEFVEGMGSFSNVLFLSTGVYRAGALAAGIRMGYHFAYTGASHLVALMLCMEDQSRTCFCPEEIVFQNAPEDPSERWALIPHAVAIGTLLDLPLPAPVRTALAARVLETFPTTEQIMLQLVLLSAKEGDARTSLFYYDQIQSRFYRFDPSLMRRAKRALYRLLLYFPRVGRLFVSLAYRATRKKNVSLSLLHDRFARL